MAYRSILVHLDIDRGCPGRVAAAVELATRLDAHLIGLYPTAEYVMPAFAAGGLPAEVLAMQRRQAVARAESGLAAFREAAERGGAAHEARLEPCTDVDVPDVLSLHLRYADLAILGQPDPQDPASPGRSLLENVVLASGRPALIVPFIGAAKPPGEKVMVAWDGGREAARAVADALPLLKAARSVTVMVVNASRGSGNHGEEPGADIATHLARHGVTVEVHHSEASDISIGDVLLSRISDEGTDLLVMGAYGHSRLRELVLGGVTRTLLGHMTVPVLMSH